MFRYKTKKNIKRLLVAFLAITVCIITLFGSLTVSASNKQLLYYNYYSADCYCDYSDGWYVLRDYMAIGNYFTTDTYIRTLSSNPTLNVASDYVSFDCQIYGYTGSYFDILEVYMWWQENNTDYFIKCNYEGGSVYLNANASMFTGKHFNGWRIISNTNIQFYQINQLYYTLSNSVDSVNDNLKTGFDNIVSNADKNTQNIISNDDKNTQNIISNDDKNTQAIIDNQQQMQQDEIDSATEQGSQADSIISDITGGVDTSTFENAIYDFVGVFDHTGTEAIIKFPAIKVPAIGGLFEEQTLSEEKEVNLTSFWDYLPQGLHLLVTALFTCALIFYCLYELRSLILYALTLRSD